MSILKCLFEMGLEFPRSWKEELRYGDDSESVRQLKRQVEGMLHKEQLALWKEYHDKGLQLHHLECRKEFERGLVLGVKLLMEVISRAENIEC